MVGKGEHGKKIGDKNREAVRSFMRTHIGATNIECGKAIGLSHCKVGKHLKAIRKEWKEEEKST